MNNEFQLSYLNDNDRLNAYNQIVKGNFHLFSKGKLQEDKLDEISKVFYNLAEKDPIFLSHLTSYVIKKLKSKDLKILAVFFNSLSDADGTPFIEGEKLCKPNLRSISQSAVQMLDPKMVHRVIELAILKKGYSNKHQLGTHFSKRLKTAVKKYLKYREQNLFIVKGIKKAGLSKIYKNLYRFVRIAPSNEVAKILRWKQKDGRDIKIEKAFTFDGKTDLEIAETIRKEKISVPVALGMLPNKLSPVIAVSLLEQSTGNQAIILQNSFKEQGLLDNKDVQKLFTEKVETAKDAIDRIERINTSVSKDIKKVLDNTKSKKRKEEMGNIIDKIFLHIDISSSMHDAIEIAKKSGSIIAECVPNPEENFQMGVFTSRGRLVNNPIEFTQAGFMRALYGLRPSGMTDVFALYPHAVKNGFLNHIYITDSGHNGKPISIRIEECDRLGYARPKSIVIVTCGNTYNSYNHENLKSIIEKKGIPVTLIHPSVLTESANVVQAIKTAIKGQIVVLDEILNTPLLKLPKWWGSVA